MKKTAIALLFILIAILAISCSNETKFEPNNVFIETGDSQLMKDAMNVLPYKYEETKYGSTDEWYTTDTNDKYEMKAPEAARFGKVIEGTISCIFDDFSDVITNFDSATFENVEGGLDITCIATYKSDNTSFTDAKITVEETTITNIIISYKGDNTSSTDRTSSTNLMDNSLGDLDLKLLDDDWNVDKVVKIDVVVTATDFGTILASDSDDIGVIVAMVDGSVELNENLGDSNKISCTATDCVTISLGLSNQTSLVGWDIDDAFDECDKGIVIDIAKGTEISYTSGTDSRIIEFKSGSNGEKGVRIAAELDGILFGIYAENLDGEIELDGSDSKIKLNEEGCIYAGVGNKDSSRPFNLGVKATTKTDFTTITDLKDVPEFLMSTDGDYEILKAKKGETKSVVEILGEIASELINLN